MKIAIAVSILFLFLFCSCSKEDMAEGTAKIDIDFVWDLNPLARSPEIHQENVSDEAGRLSIYCHDVTANDYSHGRGSLS